MLTVHFAEKSKILRAISCLRCGVVEAFALLGYYAA
jgi:hypothetical protein